MGSMGTSDRSAAFGLSALAFVAFCGTGASAQPDVRVYAGDVSDRRFSGGYETGGLTLRVKVRGDDMEGTQALRFLLQEARDDLGGSLLPEAKDEVKFSDVRITNHEEQISLRNPARDATSFSVSGQVEIFNPGRDPNAVVKVAKALASPGKPLTSPGLKAAKVALTVLPRAKLPKTVVSFLGRTADIDRIRSVRILRENGTEIRVTSRGWISDSEQTRMTLEAAEPVPANASLVFTIFTEKSLARVPFALKGIPLP